MRARILELSRLRIAAHPIIEAPLEKSSALAFCNEMAGHVVGGGLDAFIIPADAPADASNHSDRIDAEYSLQLQQGQPAVRFVKEETGGSCRSDAIFAIKSDGKAAKYKESDDEDSGVGTYDELIYYGRRYYVVTAGADKNSLLIKAISPQGELRRLCRLDASDTQTIVVRAKDPAVCSAAAAKKLPSPLWSAVEPTQSLIVDLTPGFPDSMAVAQVDLAGNGSTQVVLRYHISSGAGCGSSTSTLVVVSKDLKTVEKSAVAKRLESVRTDDSADILLSRKHAYVAGAFNDDDDSVLLSLETDTPLEVCRFRNRTTYTVGRMFPQDENL